MNVEQALEHLALGLGVTFGAATVLLLHAVLWTSLAGAMQELMEEWLCDPIRLRRYARHSANGSTDDESVKVSSRQPVGVLVSDLHLDFWSDGRRVAFESFLEGVKKCRSISHVFLNGDLMDLPLHPLHDGQGEPNEFPFSLDPPRYDRPLPQHLWPGVMPERLDATWKSLGGAERALAEKTVCYVTGNHDIGISGARYYRPDVNASPAQLVWNPSVLIQADKAAPQRAIYIEHGQAYDPFLWLYLRYALLDLMRGGHSQRDRSFLRGMQRGGKIGRKAPGPRASGQYTPMEWLTMFSYRQAARRARNRLRRIYPDLEITAVVFGHTHLPDYRLIPTKRTSKYFGPWRYINSGSWDNKTTDQNYCLIYSDCTISGPHQWPRDPLPC